MIQQLRTLGALLLVSASPLAAEVLEEIVVTASSVSDGYYDMPAITLKRKADFLVQEIRFVNDSRSPDLRKQEIMGSIGAFLKAASRSKGIELSYGEGFLLPIDLSDDSLQLINDRNRVDTNYVDVYVKSSVTGARSVKAQISLLRGFIAEQKLVGRTEIEPRGDVGLSIVGPEQYRYEILRQITEENRRIREIVGADCAITVGGLEGRVSWERTSIDELTLYIPYGTEIKCGE